MYTRKVFWGVYGGGWVGWFGVQHHQPTAALQIVCTSKFCVIISNVHSNTASMILGTYCWTVAPSFSIAVANSDSTSGSLAPAIFR